MKSQCNTLDQNHAAPSAELELAEVSGGPHDGEHLLIGSNQSRLELRHKGKSHRYYRTSARPVFIHEVVIARAMGSGR